MGAMEEAILENVGALAAAVATTPTQCIPNAFFQPLSERPALAHNAYTEELLPVVDLKFLTSNSASSGADATEAEQRKSIAKEVGKASREWGFFQVINHGLPVQIIHKLAHVGGKFFTLPTEVKEKASLGLFQGYEGRHSFIPSKVPWSETFTLQISPHSNVNQLANKISKSDEYNGDDLESAVVEYADGLHRLGMLVLELIAEDIGLSTDFFSKNFRKTYSGGMRMNYYPPCPLPEMTLGLGAHADPNCLTMLYQDEVGGLQIKRIQDGRWIAVKPHPDSLVLNIGDSLQAWSNGLLKSVEHRAVVNNEKPRLSVAFFYSPDESVVMRVPEELVDEEHPLQYKPFTWAEYVEQIKMKRKQGKGGLDTFMKITP